jgi:GR25 family glycosyltransferase involved in LPS biosynthesis
MDLLENTLFINLEDRKDRLEHALAEFEKMGIKAERVNAVKLKNGAIGCTMSHIKCIELAKERKYEQVFVCEDDITFLNVDLFKENIEKFYDNDDILWDVLIVGGNNVPPFQQVEPYCARVFSCQTTTGYIVKRSYYDTLLKNFKDSVRNLIKTPENKREFALDIYWKRLQMQDFWYMITPPTVTQYENYSDIEEQVTNYDHLMLDMDKKWYIERMQQMQEKQKELERAGMNLKFN